MFDAIDHLERDSEAWQVFDGIGDERRFVLRRFPCVLVYLEMETEIVITAVVYGGFRWVFMTARGRNLVEIAPSGLQIAAADLRSESLERLGPRSPS